MLRSVHMKLVMIMVLLILSLMAVVGAFFDQFSDGVLSG